MKILGRVNKLRPFAYQRRVLGMFEPQKRFVEVLRMSALSPTMTSGTITEWFVQPGDEITPGSAVCSVQTDKAENDFEVPDEGILGKILLETGKHVKVGTPIALIADDEEDMANIEGFVVPDFEDDGPNEVAKEEVEKEEPVAQKATPEPQKSSAQKSSAETKSDGVVRASPFAKTLAHERGIELSQVVGTGPNGRIIAADIEEFTPSSSQVVQGSVSQIVSGGDYADIPVSDVRKVIAQRLSESKQNIPHYYLTVECTIDEMLRTRKDLNSKKEGLKLSVNDFIVKAAAKACQKVPEVNSSWQGDFIRQYNNVDVSIAVQTEYGLITPIVFNSHAKGLETISSEVKALAQKARERTLQPHEFQGGTFTVSNLGMFGIKEFSAIINPPQAAILAVGGAQKKVIQTEEGQYQTVNTLTVTLSCDHRVIDGAVGAEFLKEFKSNIENPLYLML